MGKAFTDPFRLQVVYSTGLVSVSISATCCSCMGHFARPNNELDCDWQCYKVYFFPCVHNRAAAPYVTRGICNEVWMCTVTGECNQSNSIVFTFLSRIVRSCSQYGESTATDCSSVGVELLDPFTCKCTR